MRRDGGSGPYQHVERIGGQDGVTHPQDLPLVLVEDVCRKAPVCPENLSSHGRPQTMILFGHVSYGVSSSVHNDVSVCLLESKKDIHHSHVSYFRTSGHTFQDTGPRAHTRARALPEGQRSHAWV